MSIKAFFITERLNKDLKPTRNYPVFIALNV